MACISCGIGGSKSFTKKLRLEMKQILIDRGFRFVGSCNCHGCRSETYEHISHPFMRMEVCVNQFWVKQRTPPNPNFNTIHFGAIGHFNEAMEKYFTTK